MSAARNIWRVASPLHALFGVDKAAEVAREIAAEEQTKRSRAFWLAVAALIVMLN